MEVKIPVIIEKIIPYRKISEDLSSIPAVLAPITMLAGAMAFLIAAPTWLILSSLIVLTTFARNRKTE